MVDNNGYPWKGLSEPLAPDVRALVAAADAVIDFLDKMWKESGEEDDDPIAAEIERLTDAVVPFR